MFTYKIFNEVDQNIVKDRGDADTMCLDRSALVWLVVDAKSM